MKELVQKYLENRCTPEEAEKVLQWLQTEEGEQFFEKKFGENALALFENLDSIHYPELDSRQLFDEIRQKRKPEQTLPVSDKKLSGSHTRRKNHFSRKLFSAAAVLLIAAVAVLYLFETDFLQGDGVSYQIVETRRGERQSIRLSDGSEVILNHESRLSIPENFSETNRQLMLEGEAWFDVVPDSSQPFVVTGTNSLVKVLGTSFVVESYPGEEKTRVVVEEGRVSLGSLNDEEAEERIIEKNQAGMFVSGGEVELEDIPDPGLYTSWKVGTLIFENTPFEEVTRRMERWYDIHCIIADPEIREENFTSVFEDEPLYQVLDVIALSMDVVYEIEDDTVTFKQDHP